MDPALLASYTEAELNSNLEVWRGPTTLHKPDADTYCQDNDGILLEMYSLNMVLYVISVIQGK